jgi:hypothetical protein
MTDHVPTKRQARFIMASIYALPVVILIAGVVYIVKNPTWVDLVGSCLAFGFAGALALIFRKFISSNTLVLPTKTAIGLYLLYLPAVLAVKLPVHFYEAQNNAARHFNWTSDLAFYVILILVLSPFALCVRIPLGKEVEP